jgi:Membrane protease subunits, stomatin/prohibitin homologs
LAATKKRGAALPVVINGKASVFLIAGAIVIWGLSGFYIVDEGTHGVETRFGKYVATTQSGLNWHLPTPIERVDVVDVKQQRYIEVGYRSGGTEQALGSVPKEALMLTKDENIVDVRLAVQYQVKDAKDFIFNIVNPAATLKQVTESAQRGVIGSSKMDFVLTEGRSEIVAQIKRKFRMLWIATNPAFRLPVSIFKTRSRPNRCKTRLKTPLRRAKMSSA